MRHMAPRPDDSPDLRRLAELYGCTLDDLFTDGHEPAAERLQQLEARVAELERLLDRLPTRARTRDERSSIRGSEPAGRGRGWGF